jgi:hypothetical protein
MTAWIFQAPAVELAWRRKESISCFSTVCGSLGVGADPNDSEEQRRLLIFVSSSMNLGSKVKVSADSENNCDLSLPRL